MVEQHSKWTTIYILVTVLWECVRACGCEGVFSFRFCGGRTQQA